MEKLLTIIIPVFNIEQYIDRCINSIIIQDTKFDLIEVIIINDGSTDQSRSKIENIQKGHPYIQLIHQENRGLASARNTGLSVASGRYIFFLDGDDFLCNKSLPKLINAIKEYNEDIILFNMFLDKKNTHKLLTSHLPPAYNKIFTTKYTNNYTILSSACQGLIKRSLIEKYSIRMPIGKLAEDDDFSLQIFAYAETLRYLPIDTYIYTYRPDSISNKLSRRHSYQLITDRLSILESLHFFIQKFDENKKKGLTRKLNFLSLDIIRQTIRKKTPHRFLKSILSDLSRLGNYPLPKQKYGYKYNIFRIILSQPIFIYCINSIKIFNRFF